MLFIHIGRGKTGSSTIQAFADRNSAALGRLGVTYPDYGRHRSGHLPLAQAIRVAGSDRRALDRLQAEVARDPHRKVLISSEHFFNSPALAIGELKSRFGADDVQVIAYVRDYPGWIQSLYAQSTRKGRNALDFDAYFEANRPRISALAALQRWADAFGWRKIRVRTRHPADLSGGALISDLLKAVDVQGAGLDLAGPPENVSPAWTVLELGRAMSEMRRTRATSDRRAEKELLRLLAVHLARRCEPIAPARYLSARQLSMTTASFNRDMRVICERTGTPLSLLTKVDAAGERPFLPSIEAIPADLLEAVLYGLPELTAERAIVWLRRPERLYRLLALRRRLRRRLAKGLASSAEDLAHSARPARRADREDG